MKVAVVTDSNSGITQAQAKEMGVYVLPMPFMIDGTEYLEDINLTQKEFYEHLSGDHDVSTSQPSPETILNLWEKLLEEYDAVVHIPMSSGLSSSCQTAKMLAEDFDGKVQVADNHRISVTQRRSVQDALDMAAAAGVRMRQLVDQDELRPAPEGRVQVELPQCDALIGNHLGRELFQPIQQRHGLRAGVRLDIARHHVHARIPRLVRRFQHGVGLAHARGIAEKDFEFSRALRGRRPVPGAHGLRHRRTSRNFIIRCF